MVDALRRAAMLLDTDGVVIDVHPTPKPARLEIADGSQVIHIADRVDDGAADGARARHLAADRAVDAAVARGVLRREATTEFTYRTHADTVDELLELLETRWKQPHFSAADLERARGELSRRRAAKIVVTEHVTASRLAR